MFLCYFRGGYSSVTLVIFKWRGGNTNSVFHWRLEGGGFVFFSFSVSVLSKFFTMKTEPASPLSLSQALSPAIGLCCEGLGA